MKYQRLASLGCKDIGIRRFEFATKTQFLSLIWINKSYVIKLSFCKKQKRSVSLQTTSDQTTSDQTTSNQTTNNQTTSDQATSDQATRIQRQVV